MPKFLSTDLPKLKDEEDDRSIKKSILDLLDKINSVADAQYPVGYVYTQYSGQTAPATLFGGTWTDITATSLPTQVYDSGSNANGSWIRYTDGTMTQWGTTTLVSAISTAMVGGFRSSAPAVPLPLSFIDVTYSFVASGSKNDNAIAVVAYPSTAPNGLVYWTSVTSQASSTLIAQWQAIGKWSSAPVYPVTLWKRTGGSLNLITGTSQVTGIYDSGTNSNGSWIRFTDGTMMQWGNVTVTLPAAIGDVWTTCNLPIQFTSTYTPTYTVEPNLNWNFIPKGVQYSTTYFTINVYNQVVVAQTLQGRWFASGKWK